MRLGFVTKSAVSLALAIVCIGCGPTFSNDEVARVSSPDGTMDAVLFESNAGATTSFGYEVQLGAKGVRTGKSVARFYGAVRNSQAYGVDLRWQRNDTLSIEYLTTKAPPRVQDLVDVNGRAVRIVTHSGVEDRSAPAGGMLWNLHQH
jgi:hypothetical protein